MYGSGKGGLSGSASSILERAKGQLQGKRYGVMTRSAGSLNRSTPGKDTEEDDLNVYLSQLSRKTGKSNRNVGQVEDDKKDVSDLSISSGEGLGLGLSNSTLNASKFLKKSHSQTLASETAKQVSSASGPLRKSATTPNFLNRTAPAFTSSALQKAAQLGAKFAKKKAAIAKREDSDSDEDLKFNINETSKNRKEDTVHSNERDDSRFLKKTSKKNFYVSESDDSSINTESEDKFGRDGSMFLKKSTQPQEKTADLAKKKLHPDNSDDISSDVSFGHVPTSRFLKKKSSDSSAIDGFSTSTPKKGNIPTHKVNQGKDGFNKTAPVVASSNLDMSLDSDEEDLKDFIDNLTPTSTPEVPPVREVDESVNEDDDKPLKPTYKRSLTPGPAKHAPTVAFSESSDDGVDAGSSVSESIDEDIGGLGSNVMQIEDLEPAKSQQEILEQRKLQPKPKAVARQAWSESGSDNSEVVASEKENHSTLNLLGLQTVDDLLQHHSDKSSGDGAKHGGYGSDFETVTEIPTQRTEEIPEESIRSGVQSSRRVEAEDTHSSDDSVSRSVTESSTRTVPDSYTSYSKSSRSYSRSSYSRSRMHSGKRSTSEQTQTYSEDFQSSTHEGTDTELEELPSDDKDTTTVTQSQSYTSYSKTTTIKSVTPKKKEGKGRRDGMVDAAVQADGTEGLLHHWITDSAIAGIGSVTKKEPTPVTTHIVNPEALEALANFSPSLLALNDSLLSQLQLARESVQNTLRLHRSLLDSIENDYEYTTLENTKEFIAQHRRPKLTMEQALAMVHQEMEEDARL